jgi:hypothetical protein
MSSKNFSRAQLRTMEEAQEHLAATVGAAATAVDVAAELKLYTPRPDLLIADMESAGLLGYDEENCYLLVPMG